jgi:large subunit ribosomal protein L15
MRAKKPYQKRRKRVGRGRRSGHGKTSCRGEKGHGARSGVAFRPDFEGGQTPYYRRVPKRGFTNPTRKEYAVVNLDQLESLGQAEITPDVLISSGVIKKVESGLKILGRGKLTRKMNVSAHRFSIEAKKAIEAAGGQAVLIGQKSE